MSDIKQYDVIKDSNGDYKLVAVSNGGCTKQAAESICKQLNNDKGWADRKIKY